MHPHRAPRADAEVENRIGAVMEEPEAPPPFVVDRPFAFTVSDRETGTVLFLGSVHDPRG